MLTILTFEVPEWHQVGVYLYQNNQKTLIMQYYTFRIWDISKGRHLGCVESYGDLEKALRNGDDYALKLEYVCDNDGLIDSAYVCDGQLPKKMKNGMKIHDCMHALLDVLSR